MVVAAEDAVVVAIDPPAQARGEELRADLVVVRVSENAEQISALGREFEMGRIEVKGRPFGAWWGRAGRFPSLDPAEKRDQAGEQSEQVNGSFHERAEAYFARMQLQSRRHLVMLAS